MNVQEQIIQGHIRALRDAAANYDDALATAAGLALLERAAIDLNRIAAALEKLAGRYT